MSTLVKLPETAFGLPVMSMKVKGSLLKISIDFSGSPDIGVGHARPLLKEVFDLFDYAHKTGHAFTYLCTLQ
jgi:hypothetical protein